jgi:serine/threonine-protein kinase PpkA
MQIPGYRIIRKINQGGMSTVYLAIQLSVGREVALKVMSPALNADPIFSERFQREANIVGQLSHPNIVSIYDIGRYKNLNYIAMDYLPGGSVHDKLSTGLSPKEVLRIIAEIAHSLDHAHEKGYIHRDIKPENILFREDDSAVLSDFGVAKTVSSASKMTNAGTVVGTPHYMSPEQARGKPIDGRSDLYSLGVVFYEMLTGSVPYQADEAVAIAIKHLTAPIPKLPPQFSLYQNLLNRLLAKDADDRFQRGRECVEMIESINGTNSGSSPRYLTQTEPTAVQVLSLFKALLLTSYAAILVKSKSLLTYLFSWRWKPKRGLYRHPQTEVTEIRTEANTEEDDRATIISTRVQRAAHYQEVKNTKLRVVFRAVPIIFVTLCIWSAFSVAVKRFDIPGENQLPTPLQAAANHTALAIESQLTQWFNDDEQEKDINRAPSDVAETATNITANKNTPAGQLTQAVDEGKDTTSQSLKPVVPPPPPQFTVTVNASPDTSRIRILNISEKYYPGIKLLPGKYHIEVSQDGFDTKSEWITLSNAPLSPTIKLRKTPVAGAVFYNNLTGVGGKGPAMVIIPAGSFLMGDKTDSSATPVRRVRFKNPFAVSQYEITFADYDKFARATGHTKPNDKRWGRGSRPVINITWEEAKAYANWLRKTTGRKYRLATEAEWEYVARASTKTAYWWGSLSPQGRANCRRGCESEYSGLFTAKTAPVGSYSANRFRVFDTAGNVAEWVEDCYQDHYLGAPRNGTAVTEKRCSAHSVRGGSMKQNKDKLASSHRDNRPAAQRFDDVGFRVVVDLY